MTDYSQAVRTILDTLDPLAPVRLATACCANLTVAQPPPAARPGSGFLPAGTLLSPASVAAAMAGGARELTVHPRPRVAIVTQPPGGPAAAQTQAALLAAARAADCPAESADAAALAEGPFDLVVCATASPGMAVGLAQRAGAAFDVLCAGVAMQPGGPAALARLKPAGMPGAFASGASPSGPRYLLELPADPVGAVIGWLMLGTVVVQRLMGRGAGQVGPARVMALSDGIVPAAGDVTLFVPGVLRPGVKLTSWRVRPLAPFSGGPEDVERLGVADGLIVRPAHAGSLAARAVCDVVLLGPLEAYRAEAR